MIKFLNPLNVELYVETGKIEIPISLLANRPSLSIRVDFKMYIQLRLLYLMLGCGVFTVFG